MADEWRGVGSESRTLYDELDRLHGEVDGGVFGQVGANRKALEMIEDALNRRGVDHSEVSKNLRRLGMDGSFPEGVTVFPGSPYLASEALARIALTALVMLGVDEQKARTFILRETKS